MVFVDSGGAFNNDTECVNGIRGNAADHLTKDVVPYMVSNFGVSPDRSSWGVAGWSMGGTCAVDLTVMHPEMFSAFVDVAGDFFPECRQQGANHRPAVRRKRRRVGGIRPEHGDRPARPIPRRVRLVRDLFRRPARQHAVTSRPPTPPRCASRDATPPQTRATRPRPPTRSVRLAVPTASTARCVPQPGKHDWPFADRAFAAALPWLAGQLGTPGVSRTSLPDESPADASSGATVVVPAQRSNTATR